MRNIHSHFYPRETEDIIREKTALKILVVLLMASVVSLFHTLLVSEVSFYYAHNYIVSIFKIERKHTVLLTCYLLM